MLVDRSSLSIELSRDWHADDDCRCGIKNRCSVAWYFHNLHVANLGAFSGAIHPVSHVHTGRVCKEAPVLSGRRTALAWLPASPRNKLSLCRPWEAGFVARCPTDSVVCSRVPRFSWRSGEHVDLRGLCISSYSVRRIPYSVEFGVVFVSSEQHHQLQLIHRSV